eukprot:95395_1
MANETIDLFVQTVLHLIKDGFDVEASFAAVQLSVYGDIPPSQFISQYDENGTLPEESKIDDTLFDHGEICVDKQISNCRSLSRLSNVMNLSNRNENINLTQILDDYFHLVYKHDNDEEFEFIYNTMGHCDLNQCISFKRRTGRQICN